MQKFFVETEQIDEKKVIITGEDVKHIANVLKLNKGEAVLVGDRRSGSTYLCNIEKIDKEQVILEIIEKTGQTTEPMTYIHLFQGLPKADKMEYIIQKGTEIGISEFTPVQMSRSIVQLEEKGALKKIERWNKIAETAAKQSKRDIIPKINFIQNLKNLYENLKEYDIVLVAYEEEHNYSIKKELAKYKKNKNGTNKIAIIIGPEGGISKEEIESLQNYGAIPVTLGKRILRTETAPITMASVILYELDDMN